MANVLLIGTDKDRSSGIRSLMREDGHEVIWHRNESDWPDREGEVLPELIVAAIDSPDGVMRARSRRHRGFLPPLLLVSEDGGPMRDPFLAERLVDRIVSPFSQEELLARIDALIRVRRVIQGRSIEEDETAEETSRPTRGLRAKLGALLGSRIPRYPKPLGPYLEVAARIAEWSDRRDAFQPGHQERVTTLCAMIAEGLGLDDDRTVPLLRAAMLHDIGKIAVPLDVLHQKDPLQESQLRLIRTHPRRGAELLSALDPDSEVAEAILYHHERPDGTGYYKKTTEGTPIAARVLAVAEVYDAMTTSQLLETCTQEAALDRLRELRGEAFDTDCVNALVDVLKPRPDVIPLTS